MQYLESDEYEITGAMLHYLEAKDERYLHLRTMAEVDDADPLQNGMVLGVELGVENIAVTSTGTFWSGSELDHWHREYEKRRAALQRCGSCEAQSDALSGEERDWPIHCDVPWDRERDRSRSR